MKSQLLTTHTQVYFNVLHWEISTDLEVLIFQSKDKLKPPNFRSNKTDSGPISTKILRIIL